MTRAQPQAEPTAVAEPAISLLMPLFNGGDYVMLAVDDALEQMRPGDELVIQDAGSTDGCLEALTARFGAHPGLRVVSEPDRGQADALNKALARAENPVIGWLNADDRLRPGALDAVRRAWMSRPGVEFVYGSFEMIDADETVLRHAVPRPLALYSLMWQPHLFSGAIFWDADVVRRTGGFDETMHMCMDVELLLRMVARGGPTIQVPETLAAFRWHEGSKTGANDFTVVREAYRCYRRYAGGPAGELVALGSAGCMGLVWWSTPLRLSKPYTAWRLRRAQRRGAGETVDAP